MSVQATIALEVDEEVLIKRLLNRGKDSGRADDQDEKRFAIGLRNTIIKRPLD